MVKLVNRAKMTTATTGTGTLTLGSAVAGYQTFANAGVANSNIVRYTIEDGNNWEVGLGTYSSTGTTLTRGTIESSTGTAINLSGNATVFVTAAAGDLQELVTFAETFALPTADGTNGQVLTTNGSGTLTFTTVGGASLLGDTDSATPFETSLGFEAGNSTTGVSNTFIGYQAGKANSTGTGNTAVGYLAATALTTGADNVALGRGALDAATTGGQNIAIGPDALGNGIATTASGYNIGIGNSAIGDLTTGTNNLAFGRLASRYLTTGTDNVALGSSALTLSTAGFRNIAIGSSAMGGFDVSGGNNTALGYWAGLNISTASHNFLGGYQSGAALTTGSNNVAIGNGALDAATTGGVNVAIGQSAMGAGVATAASGYNVAIGASAFNAVTTGYYNVALGLNAMLSSTTAYQNVVIGPSAGRPLTTGFNNVIIGNSAAFGSPLTTGSNNTVIGNGAGPSATDVSNEITLGNTGIANFRVPGVGFNFSTTQGAVVPKTITAAGTTGAQTINKTAGSVNFAAAATSLVVTNSFVTANSVIIATVGTNDTTMKSVAAVANSGSFTLYANAAPTAETRVNFMVVN